MRLPARTRRCGVIVRGHGPHLSGFWPPLSARRLLDRYRNGMPRSVGTWPFYTPLRFLAVGYADPHALRRLGEGPADPVSSGATPTAPGAMSMPAGSHEGSR